MKAELKTKEKNRVIAYESEGSIQQSIGALIYVIFAAVFIGVLMLVGSVVNAKLADQALKQAQNINDTTVKDTVTQGVYKTMDATNAPIDFAPIVILVLLAAVIIMALLGALGPSLGGPGFGGGYGSVL